MDDLEMLIDLHRRNDRQGPGGEHETRRALDLTRLDPSESISVADIGCGTGASALVLARALNASVTAIDAAPAFIETLRSRTEAENLGDRIEGVVGRMEDLPLDAASIDLLWSEGAVYNMGFGSGVCAWRKFLRPGGILSVTELTWTTESRPADVQDFWMREYPGIGTVSANLRTLELEGYSPLGFFFLPRHCWERNYYAPVRSGFPAFLARHSQSEKSKRIVAAEEAEMRLYRERGDWYGYAFYIAQKIDTPDESC